MTKRTITQGLAALLAVTAFASSASASLCNELNLPWGNHNRTVRCDRNDGFPFNDPTGEFVSSTTGSGFIQAKTPRDADAATSFVNAASLKANNTATCIVTATSTRTATQFGCDQAGVVTFQMRVFD